MEARFRLSCRVATLKFTLALRTCFQGLSLYLKACTYEIMTNAHHQVKYSSYHALHKAVSPLLLAGTSHHCTQLKPNTLPISEMNSGGD